jgi:hypothetical protein
VDGRIEDEYLPHLLHAQRHPPHRGQLRLQQRRRPGLGESRDAGVFFFQQVPVRFPKVFFRHGRSLRYHIDKMVVLLAKGGVGCQEGSARDGERRRIELAKQSIAVFLDILVVVGVVPGSLAVATQ